MAERAAHLVDRVIPDVPVRQWVLSLPHRLRYQLAWDHDACRRVTPLFLSAVFRLLRDRARGAGLEQPRGGAVAIIQRFGGALNLNVHIHELVLDGVFARDAVGEVGFYRARRLTTRDVEEVLATVEPRIRRSVAGGEREADHGGSVEDGALDSWTHEAPVLAGLAAASVQGLVALGPHSGTRVRRFGRAQEVMEPRVPGPCHARLEWAGPACGPRRPGGSARAARAGLPLRTATAHHVRATHPHALIEAPGVIGRILRHLGLPTHLPVARPARAPPLFAAAGEARADEYESAP